MTGAKTDAKLHHRTVEGKVSWDDLCSKHYTELTKEVVMSDTVNHPSYYGGGDNIYEVIKVIEAWGLNFNLGTCVKYIPRAGKKRPTLEAHIEDLEMARWYLSREIETLKRGLK